MHHVIGKVCQLLLIHACRVAHDKAHLGRQLGVLVHGLVHPVNAGLGVLHHVDVTKPRRAVLFLEQHIEHKRVFAVVIEAPLSQLWVVFTGVQDDPIAEFAVVQHLTACGILLFVVPVHHHALVRCADVVIVDVLRHADAAAGVFPQLWPLLFQPVVALDAQRKEIRAVLDVHAPRLPIQPQDVHAADCNVAHTAPRRRVPENTLNAGPLFELAPPAVRPHFFVVRLLQDHRQNAGELFCCFLVVHGPRQHVRFRVVVHRVGVLVGDGVKQPPARGLRLAVHHPVRVVFPVPHPEPFIVFDDPLFQRGLPTAVPLQNGLRLGDLRLANGLRPALAQRLIHRQAALRCRLPAGLAAVGRPHQRFPRLAARPRAHPLGQHPHGRQRRRVCPAGLHGPPYGLCSLRPAGACLPPGRRFLLPSVPALVFGSLSRHGSASLLASYSQIL